MDKPLGMFVKAQVQDGVKLGVGDVVTLIVAMNSRSGERNGRRVRRLREAPEKPAGAEGADKEKPEFVAERNPNAVKYIGHKLVLGENIHFESVRLLPKDAVFGSERAAGCSSKVCSSSPGHCIL